MQRETQILVSFDLVFLFILVASGEIFDLSYGKIWGHALLFYPWRHISN